MCKKYYLWLIMGIVPIILFILAAGCTPASPTVAPATPTMPYMKMQPPPDSDKPLPVPAGDNSCWLHTASNQLAGAGYGDGNTVVARANDIWGDMSAHYINSDGTYNGGRSSTAMQWWLGSTNNTWTMTNTYTLVTTYGGATTGPWANANGARTIANDLRSCSMVGLGIRWPTDAKYPDGSPVVGVGGHAITLWGDEQTSVSALTANPGGLRVTDSDTDTGGEVQAYTYDAYTNPNPGGPNEGNGWYFNAYGSPHPYICEVWVLSSTAPAGGSDSVRVTGSFKIQNTSSEEASDLHYKVGTDVDILTYRTWLDWVGTPAITENQPPPRRELTVDWTFTDKKVPVNKWITISTEFVERRWNAIKYSDVHFTYPSGGFGLAYPDLIWQIDTPNLAVEQPELIRNVVGGYVIGSFDLLDRKNPGAPVVKYRLVHQYLYDQSPELHDFLLNTENSGDLEYLVANLSFGHSYSYPTEEELWRFENWMTRIKEQLPLSEGIKIAIDWTGQLPYPEGFPPSTGGNPEIK